MNAVAILIERWNNFSNNLPNEIPKERIGFLLETLQQFSQKLEAFREKKQIPLHVYFQYQIQVSARHSWLEGLLHKPG